MNSLHSEIATRTSAPPETPAPSTRTRYFWYGYLLGGALGVVLGYFMGDMIGWVYMTGTVGCIAALPFEPSSS